MISGQFQPQIIFHSELESSNIYALELLREKKVLHEAVIRTDFQRKGKGQKDAAWQSEAGKNLLMSVVVDPKLKVESQFLISKITSIAIANYLDSLSVGGVQVKWPNDILVNRRKIAGILIENIISGNKIHSSIIGIGLNVNQLEFDDYKRTATSLAIEKLRTFSVEKLAEELSLKVIEAFRNTFSSQDIDGEYLKYLYGYGVPLTFEDKDGQFSGVILGVMPNGSLQLNRNGKLKVFDIKELAFKE